MSYVRSQIQDDDLIAVQQSNDRKWKDFDVHLDPSSTLSTMANVYKPIKVSY